MESVEAMEHPNATCFGAFRWRVSFLFVVVVRRHDDVTDGWRERERAYWEMALSVCVNEEELLFG